MTMDKREERVVNEVKDLFVGKLEEVTKKGTVNLTDAKAMLDVFCLLQKIRDYEMECCNDLQNEGDGSFAMTRSMPRGHYMNRGWSGHSINDRMVNALEKMYDDAPTEHERDVLTEWIRKIKMSV